MIHWELSRQPQIAGGFLSRYELVIYLSRCKALEDAVDFKHYLIRVNGGGNDDTLQVAASSDVWLCGGGGAHLDLTSSGACSEIHDCSEVVDFRPKSLA